MKKALIILGVVLGCKGGSMEDKLLAAFKKDPVPVIISLKNCPATNNAVGNLLMGNTTEEINKLEKNWHHVATEVYENLGDNGKCNSLVEWAIHNAF